METVPIHRDDPVRPHKPVSGRQSESRVKVRIASAWPFVDGGHLFNEGVTECVLYESDLERIRTQRMPDMVEIEPGHWRTDETKIDEAKAFFEAGKQSFLDAINAPLIREGLAPQKWEAIAHEYEGPRTWQACYVERNFAFANVAGYKSVGPVREIQILETGLAPLVDEATRMQIAQAHATAQAVAKALGARGDDAQPAMQRIADLEREVAELRAEREAERQEKAARKR